MNVQLLENKQDQSAQDDVSDWRRLWLAPHEQNYLLHFFQEVIL